MRVNTLDRLIADGQLAGRRVFIRSDLNVPQDDAGNITEDTRIRASVPAIRSCIGRGRGGDGGVASWAARSKANLTAQFSLAPVARRLGDLLGFEVPLVRDWINGVNVSPGQVVLLENTRFNKGEKKNSDELAQKNGGVVRRVRERRVRHRPPRGGFHRTASRNMRSWRAPVRCCRPRLTHCQQPCAIPSGR